MKLKIFLVLLIVQPYLQTSAEELSENTHHKARQLYADGLYDESLNIIRKSLVGSTIPYKLRIIAANCYIKKSQNNKAVQHLVSVIDENPDQVEPIMFLSDLFQSERSYKKAIWLLKSKLSRFENSSSIRNKLAQLYYQTGAYRQARNIINQLMESNSGNEVTLNLDGLIFLRQKRYEMAIFRFRDALSRSTEDKTRFRSDLFSNIGYAYEQNGELKNRNGGLAEAGIYYKKAEDNYRLSLKVYSEHIIAINNLKRISQKIK